MPPPVHGMSVINAAMVERMRRRCPVSIVNLSPDSLSAPLLTLTVHTVFILVKSVWSALNLGRAPHGFVYLALSGGRRQVLDFAIIAACKLRRTPVCIHHHSFQYINSPSVITRTIYNLLDRNDVSIFLSASQKSKFNDCYSNGSTNYIVSNLAFMGKPYSVIQKQPSANATVHIGFLSNIVLSKGVDTFLEVVARLRAMGHPVKGRVAGPFRSQEAEDLVRAAAARFEIDYVGPVSGDSKEAFFDGIDLFLFPSRYPDEAEPLVVYEAMLAGVPVFASAVGCVPEMLPDSANLIEVHDMATHATGLVASFLARRQRSGQSGSELEGRVAERRGAAAAALERLLAALDPGGREAGDARPTI